MSLSKTAVRAEYAAQHGQKHDIRQHGCPLHAASPNEI